MIWRGLLSVLWIKRKRYLLPDTAMISLEHVLAVYGLYVSSVEYLIRQQFFFLSFDCFFFVMSPASAHEVDVRDMNSLEAYALFYMSKDSTDKEQLLNEVACNNPRSMRDRARYNPSLAAYQQGKSAMLETLDAMEQPNSQSMPTHSTSKNRRASRARQQEEQDQQGEGDSSDQEGEKGEGQKESERQDASEQESSQQEFGQDAQQERKEQAARTRRKSGEEGQQDHEGSHKKLCLQRNGAREAQRLLTLLKKVSIEDLTKENFQEQKHGSASFVWVVARPRNCSVLVF